MSLIFCFVVRATQRFIKKDLQADIMSGCPKEEDKRQLLQACPEFKEKVDELLSMKDTIKKALEVFSTF